MNKKYICAIASHAHFMRAQLAICKRYGGTSSQIVWLKNPNKAILKYWKKECNF